MSRIVRKAIFIKGMTCIQCERILREALLHTAGVKSAAVNYKEGVAYVSYDMDMVTDGQLKNVITQAGYEQVNKLPGANMAEHRGNGKLIGIFVLIAGLYLLISKTVGFNQIPEIDASMGFGMLFVIGMLTSLHCIAMCGGINLSQCLVKTENGGRTTNLKPSLQYNAGRVLSYTILGGFVGGLGSIVGFTGSTKGLIAIVAGIFMVIMGMNMLDIFPELKRFSVIIPSKWRKQLMGKNNQRGPFVVGLLNGLMPCGPLQAMQIYALGTGSILVGATSMFFFSLGTVPLMLGFGWIATMVSQNLTKKMMKVSAVLVVSMGLVMMGRGFSLSGIGLNPMANLQIIDFSENQSASAANESVAIVENGVQSVTGEVTSRGYPVLVIEKGIPVKVNFHAEANAINGCNSTLVIPDYDIQLTLQPGDNFVEFTPKETGTITYSCWMGMVTSEIKVLDKVAK